MQQVFEGDANRAGEGKPLIRFPLPVQPAPISASTAARKRSRSPPGREDSTARFTEISPGNPLTPEEHAVFCRFLEFGDQSASPSTCFFHNVKRLTPPAQRFADHAALSHSSVARQYQWCFVALRHAMSLLCRVVELDSSGYFLHTAFSSKTGSGATAVTNDAPFTSPGAPVATGPATTLELYCRFQALDLELEDAILRAEATAQTEAVPNAVHEQMRSDIDTVVACIEQSVNAFEGTLVQMFVGSSPEVIVVGTKIEDMSGSPPLEYVGKMLRELPALLQTEQWPAQFVCDQSSPSNNGETPLETTRAIASSSSSSALERTLLGARPAAETDSAVSCFLEQLGGAATSLALRSLFVLINADLWNLLGVATASPISRLAALEKLAAATSGSPETAAKPTRPSVNVETLTFQEILVRAWNRQYGALGLHRLFFEMQVLFYQYRMRVSAKSKKSGGGSGVTVGDVCELWTTWLSSLRTLSASFLAKLGSSEQSASELFSASDLRVHSCDSMRQHAVPDSGFAEVQKVALRVMSKLQAVDTNGWFAVPAFDQVNLDFTSLRYWIMSPVFSRKSKREAYRSLCRVLEQMVDSCVQKYGPTHAFSDAITAVRQQLVDVSRKEELL
ncbi:hypothetical protein JKF63_01796 [Porcisia hertigi]|uniref:Uncharacterized protein n=1 Tax=Porcisia hertigi TaxID=2761500 RepID=A0A836HJN2_9TRYP|nr:hypothetical protein JKF63_01796 [Porcisia hertigi]